MDVLLDIWQRMTTPHAALQPPTTWLTVAGAALIVLFPPVWRVARHAITIVHEGGHGVVAVLCGRRLGGIRLHSDTSGLTVSRGRPSGPGMIFTLLAGYPAPALLGLGAAWLLSRGYDVGLLWALLAALALLLVQIRNWFGLWSVAVTAAVVFGVSWFGSAQVQGVFALLVTAFLLFGALRTSFELAQSRSRRAGSSSDADQLARLTHIPGTVWVGVFIALQLGCIALSAQLLGFGLV
ncbi:M50 family metallopeptidase [Cryobacterium luteum]|uniref:M50 family peptidase n=1 Tax=Cryobacterium luteum TaxID=1424661 RepID=A0A1H8CWI8_9MICO|nr:M50 family metallopeptidase [Cryobacterium luteum]TFB91791.1 M50 family peptidase [Cryobacterium luteum]SEM98698.1 Peptidase M50B-like [Cryobacterium luteum]